MSSFYPPTSLNSWLLCLSFVASLVLPFTFPAIAGGEEDGLGLSALIGSSEDEEEEEPATLPIVTIGEFEVVSVPAEVSVFGVVETYYRQKLVSEVEGRITSLSSKLNPGMTLKEGEQVTVVEDSSYRAALVQAELAVAEAKLSLLQEERRGKLVRLDRGRADESTGTSDALALREPFLELEQLKVKAAEATLLEAKRNLANTRIVMPFDAVVISRNATPGAYVTRGLEIAEIYSTGEMSAEVFLSAQQWELLLRENGRPVPLDELSANLTNDAGEIWSAIVVSEGAIVDAETRQKSLRLKVDPRNNNGVALKPGSFVNVTLSGKAIENVLFLPASAVTLNGYLWSITDEAHGESELERYAVTPLLTTQDDMIAVDASQLPAQDKWQIILSPISRYLPGQRVIVRETGE